jgi:dTDP-4-amino-4,6-dideoxygalactose transaminase
MSYKVPFINYPLQYKKIKKEIDSAFYRVLENGDLIYREDLESFEKKLAQFCDSKFGISTGSCTGSMFVALKAAGIGPGDEVITVSHTYIATIDVIVACGAKPVLIDVRDDFNMNPNLIEGAITEKTKAIIPVHLNGRVCEMDKIMEIAKKNNLIVIEDAAQAIGAKFNEQKSGSFGLAGCYSFYPAKVLGCYGEGGGIVTSNEEYTERLFLLRDHGEKPSYRLSKDEKEKDYKEIHLFGYNTILDNMQAAFLNIKIKYLQKRIERRREIANLYEKGLSGIDKIVLPPAPQKEKYYDAFQNYVIRSQERDSLKSFLREKGIETLISWKVPNHKQKALEILHKFNLPKTEEISKEVLSLPMYPELTDEQVEYIIQSVREFY